MFECGQHPTLLDAEVCCWLVHGGEVVIQETMSGSRSIYPGKLPLLSSCCCVSILSIEKTRPV
jgi:hypothetical protein